jgi:hypothetical protein
MTPRQFLESVMRDRSADINDRVRAASALLVIPHDPPSLIPMGNEDVTLTICVPSIDDPEDGHA